MASKDDAVYIVTGAPGAGKTTALGALLRLRTDYIIVDGDWLLGAASDLAKASVLSDRSDVAALPGALVRGVACHRAQWPDAGAVRRH